MSKVKAILAVILLRLVSSTWRIKFEGHAPAKPSVVAFWHGYMLPVWKYFSKFVPAALVSQSKDGRLLSALLSSWGYNVVRGSSSKGGREALDSIISLLDTNIVLITPDGPRGPACRFKAGAVVAAQKSGVPLYLVAVHICGCITLKKSWDKFRIPYPFAKIVLSVSEPHLFPGELTRDEINESINIMNETLDGLQKMKKN